MLKNIYEVCQLISFRCIMSLSYRVTFLCNVFVQIHYTSESPVRFLFYEKSCKVVLYNYKGKKVSTQNALSASYGTVIRYVRFKIAKNQTYTVKVRTYLSVNGTTIYGKLSKARAFTTLTNIKLKYKYNYRTGKKNYTVVMPKAKNAKGIKNFTVYISKDRSKGYKKVKTAKPGKNVKISKFKGKAIKTNQIYYIKIVPNLKCKVKSDVIYQY